jgi:alkanesulfonate monooxygenase SsuD/methylene tetrahydromethanopterin reductase-like flavin-dependent oxidoreductase (luciferase family)
MIGALANRPRVLALAARHAHIWNAWLPWQANTPAAIGPTMAAVDAACNAAGRDPGTLRRSVSVQIDYPDAVPNRAPGAQPLHGSPQEIAEVLGGFARVGIDHLQVVLNPNNARSIERFGLALTAFRQQLPV